MDGFLVDGIHIGKQFTVIAGPCVIEDEESTIETARVLKDIAQEAGIALIFKASYDKANRSSVVSYRGPRMTEGLKILGVVKKETGLPVLSDVHNVAEIGPAAEVLDVIQIPAFLCRQTDLVMEAAKTGHPLNIKKGQFLSPLDMRGVIEKADAVGNQRLILTERGTCFGYNNLVVDFRSIDVMRGFGFPVFFDGTHSVRSSYMMSERRFVECLSCAALAAGADGIFLEVHLNPAKALCDGDVSLKADNGLKPLFKRLKTIWECAIRY